MEMASYARGLEGVIAAESKICRIDGERGKLYYVGYSIEDLAANCSFEEVTYLLLFGELPNCSELSDFSSRMRGSRDLAAPIQDMIRRFPSESHPMELLQSVVAYLSGYVQHRIEHSATCNCRDTLHQVAQVTSVIAAYARFKQGLDYIPPRDDLSHGANFLYMLRGEVPDPTDGEVMDKCLVLHAEHGFNASTFASRVVASTLSTCYCSISAAMGALYGSLHGGANERVIVMVDAIGAKSGVRDWVNDALDRTQRIMGMGHRVYRTKDPRAIIMEGFLERLSAKHDEFRHYDILKEIETVFRERMDKRGRLIFPNVDYYSGAAYLLLGIEPILFTPLFAAARVAGWLAHILEQRQDNRLYRPRALYNGYQQRDFVPIALRK